jgi:uncharacterized membrane protein
MTNLTLSLDEELVKRARIRAIEEGTSLSAKVREFLAAYTQTAATTAAQPRPTDPANDLLALEVIWQPEGAGEVLSSEELITAYPDLQHL